MCRTFQKQDTRQPARTWPYFDGRACQRAGTTCNFSGQVQIKQEILSKRFACPHIHAFDKLTQGGQGVNAGSYIAIFHDEAASDVLAILRAILIAAIKLSGRAVPDPAISKPVP